MKLNVEKLKQDLQAAGVTAQALENMEEKKLKAMARAFEIETEQVREPACIKEHTTKSGKTGTYLVTDSIPYIDAEGNQKNAKGLFIPVEAVDAVCEELLEARGLLKK
jgi:hypothetical protein